MPVESRIIILPVPFPECQPHSEIYNALYPCSNTFTQDSSDVFLIIINERKNGRKPYDRRDPSLLHLFQYFDTAFGITDVRLQHSAQFIIISGKSNLNYAFCCFVDLGKQIDIPQDKIGFRLYCYPETIL